MEKLLIVAADYANLTGNGKLNVMGIFNELNPHEYPYTHPTMYLVIKLRAELGEFNQKRSLTIKMVDQDGHDLFALPGEFEVPEMKEGRRPEVNVMLSLNNLEFPSPGIYQFIVMVDKDNKGSVSIQANPPKN